MASKILEPFELDLPRFARQLINLHFVGRDVANLAISVAQKMYASEIFELTPQLVDEVLRAQLKKKQKEAEYAARKASASTGSRGVGRYDY